VQQEGEAQAKRLQEANELRECLKQGIKRNSVASTCTEEIFGSI
jgi:ribosomal protein L9